MFTDAFCDSVCWVCGVYDVAGVTVNSVVDAREVFDMFVIALICLDFDLVFMRLVGVWCGGWFGVDLL